MRNPHAVPSAVLKVSAANYQAAIDAVVAYCKGHADVQEIDDAAVRATHPALADDRLWNQVRQEIGG